MTSAPDADGGRGADQSTDGLALLAPRARRVPRSVRVRLGLGAGVILLILALLVTVIVSVVAPHGASQRIDAVTAQTGRGAPSTNAASSAPTGAASVAVLYVHVLGAVARPGLYELRTGTRVIDAIGAAGGFADDADRGGVNLARLLSDGEQLVVPKIGEAPAADSAADSGPSAAAGSASGAKVNLNTATEAELETLPRIGPAMASRIVQWRKDNGRFATVDDLMNITGIGDKTFEALKDLVTT